MMDQLNNDDRPPSQAIAAQEVDLTSIKLPPDQERVALSDPHFADALGDYDVAALLGRGYLASSCVQGFAWLTEVHVAVRASAVEIAQKLLRDDGEGPLATWNTSDIFRPARAMTKMPDGTWRIICTDGLELTIHPDRVRAFLLDLQRFIVNAGTRGAAILQ